MKRIFWIMAILLIWAGSTNAGVLKVKVPVDEFEQMKSRLETLEKENNQLQQEVKSLADKTSEAETVSDKKEVESRLKALAQENNQLKQKVEELAETSSEEAGSSEKLASSLDALGRENRQLKRSVASLKEAGTVLRSDRRTARHMYFETNKKFAGHIFK